MHSNRFIINSFVLIVKLLFLVVPSRVKKTLYTMVVVVNFIRSYLPN